MNATQRLHRLSSLFRDEKARPFWRRQRLGASLPGAAAKTECSDALSDLLDVPSDLSDVLPDLSDVPSDLSDVLPDLSNVPSDLSNVPSDLSNVPSDLSNVPSDLSFFPIQGCLGLFSVARRVSKSSLLPAALFSSAPQ